jgi:hypothetical protein
MIVFDTDVLVEILRGNPEMLLISDAVAAISEISPSAAKRTEMEETRVIRERRSRDAGERD